MTAGPPPPATVTVPRFRDLDPRVHRLFLGFAFSALGSGLTLPFLYVYLAEVRDIPTATVGWLFAWMGLLGFALSPVGGTLIDRYGPRPVMVAGLCVEAVGTASIGLVEGPASAFVVASLVVAGTVALWPAATSMLTRLVPPAARQKAYGLNFMVLNAGLGVGGMLSALVIDTESVASFQRLYVIDGLTYLAYVVVLLTLPRGTGARAIPEESEAGQGEEPAWSSVLRDRTLLRVVAISALTITFGYAQLEAGLAAYAVEVAEVPARSLGWAYAANTFAIVLGQLFALRFVSGRRRSRMLALCAATWSVAWAVIAASDLVDGWVAVAVVVAGLGLFGLGETLWAPVAPAVVNDLAPEQLRGRYNALQGMTWTVGSIVGPATAGMLIGHGQPGVWVGAVVGGTALAALLFLRLGRHLSTVEEGLAPRPADEPARVA